MMKLKAILREAWRNVTTGTAHVVAFTLLFTAATAGIAVLDLLAVRQITSAAYEYQNSGASVLTLVAEGRIDGVACAALSRLPGVRSAGALRAVNSDLIPAALPASGIPAFDVTPGVPKVLRAQVTGPGIVLADQVATTLGAQPGRSVALRQTTAQVAGIYRYPDDGRRPGFGYAALIPVSAQGAFDECWVDAWPNSRQLPSLMMTTVLPSDHSERPVLTQLNSTLGGQFDGPQRLASRITGHAPALALVIGLGAGYLFVRLRRLHHASALHAGMTRSALAAMTAFEMAVWTVPAAVMTGAAAMMFVAADPGSDLALGVLGGRAAVLAPIGAYLGAAFGLTLTQERHLFCYFKTR